MAALTRISWLAVAAILASMFRLQASTLTVLGQNYKQAAAEAVRLAGLTIGALIAGPVADRHRADVKDAAAVGAGRVAADGRVRNV